MLPIWWHLGDVRDNEELAAGSNGCWGLGPSPRRKGCEQKRSLLGEVAWGVRWHEGDAAWGGEVA